MERLFKFTFRIDVFLNGDYQGSSYLMAEVSEDVAMIMMIERPIKELTAAQVLYMGRSLPDLYADVYEKVIFQETEVCRQRKYPYEADPDFSHYMFKIYI